MKAKVLIKDDDTDSMARVRTTTAGPFTSFIFGIVFFVIGVGITYFKSYPDYRTAKESSEWPQTEGVILRSEVKQEMRSSGSGRNKSSRMYYAPNIVYSYEVDGRKYKSSQIYIGNLGYSSTNSSGAYEYRNKYPVGERVTVYYMKGAASKSILEQGTKVSHYLILGGGLLFAIVGLLMVGSLFFKVIAFTTIGGVLLASLFRKKKENNRHRPNHRPNHIPIHGRKTQFNHRGNYNSNYNKSNSSKSDDVDLDIDLDDEMSHLNKVSSSNQGSDKSPNKSPWKYKWYLKGSKKDYGPYSFEKIIDYYEKGKIKDNHQCYSSVGKDIIKISQIIDKKREAS